MTTRFHVAVNLRFFENRAKRHQSNKGLISDDDGREWTHKEVMAYVAECRKKGWNLIPACGEEKCPNFDHVEHGCPGHIITEE